MSVWVVNDTPSCIPGSKTLWHDLLEWIDDAVWPLSGGDSAFPMAEHYTPFQEIVRVLAETRLDPPHCIIRNGSYFGALPISNTVPTVSLFQDIFPETNRAEQHAVAESSAHIVFNSEYTKAAYPELLLRPHSVIPLGTDFTRFRPQEKQSDHDILPNSVCWVGSSDPVKGFGLLSALIQSSKFNFCVVFKDAATLTHPRVRCFNRVPQQELVDIINRCVVGLCTSEVETQHLAGIEMGACGLPLVTTNVGAYCKRPPGPWGRVAAPNISALAFALEEVMRQPWLESPRDYWRREGYDTGSCRVAWRTLVKKVISEWPHRR